MNDELEKYYTDRFDMYTTDGWKELIETIDEIIKATDRISGIKDENDLHFKRGEISILNWVKGLKEATELAYKDLKDES